MPAASSSTASGCRASSRAASNWAATAPSASSSTASGDARPVRPSTRSAPDGSAGPPSAVHAVSRNPAAATAVIVAYGGARNDQALLVLRSGRLERRRGVGAGQGEAELEQLV